MLGLTLPLALLALCPQDPQPARASGGRLIPEQACYDVQQYDLRLRVDPGTRRIDGTLTLSAILVEGTERVALDLDQLLEVGAVRVGEREATFRHDAGRIWVDLPEALEPGAPLEVAVAYGGAPRVAPRPPWDGGFTWAETGDGRPWIATSCQGEGADLWWPCKDHPSDKPAGMDLHITVPDGLVCASNGVLVSAEPADDEGWRTFHWRTRYPISNYCVALNIAPYELLETELESVAGGSYPVQFYVLPENVDKGRAFLPEIPDHLRFYEKVCGPYPFRGEKYGVVETPHLGMEHQTIIAYGNDYRRGPFDYDWLHHHELAHEWWANLVTCNDWKDMWIHEGIGTYMQALYIEEKFGPKAYRVEMATKGRELRHQRPIAPRESKDSKEIYFAPDGGHDNDIYYKGSWVVHTLRWLVGDEKAMQTIRRWCYPDPAAEKSLDGSAVRLTDTDGIIAIAEEVAGRDLGWFFEVYLRRAQLPILHGEVQDGVLTLRWETPDGLPFPLPVPVQIGDAIRRVPMPEGRATYLVGDLPVALDPEHRVLAERKMRGQ